VPPMTEEVRTFEHLNVECRSLSLAITNKYQLKSIKHGVSRSILFLQNMVNLNDDPVVPPR
jgi:hypothetical protein